MASFGDLMMLARNRAKKTDTSARFKEILSIVTRLDLKDGLTPDVVVELLQELGTTFVKLGQIASTHPDVLPKEYCDALGELRTKARPLDFATVRAQVEGELGKPLEELFSEFDENAVGSASIAQVHRAVLPDGQTVVAVKVQRPGVVETVTNDLAIMERLVDLYDLVVRGDGKISLKELVTELVRTSNEELDFRNEAAHLERFYKNNEGREGVSSPRLYSELSTHAILTEDFVSSPCVEKIDSIGEINDDDRDKLAYLIAHNYMEQVMVDGFYHADPHAGNVLITGTSTPVAKVAEDVAALPGDVLADGAVSVGVRVTDGAGSESGGSADAGTGKYGIEWIDFGMMGIMTSAEREALGNIVMAMVKSDVYGFKRAILRVAKPTGPVDHGALLDMCQDVLDQFVSVDLESFDTGALVNNLMGSLQSTGFKLEPFLVTLGRGLVTLEGTIHLVSPRLNIMQVLIEYMRSSFNPTMIENKIRKLVGTGIEGAEASIALPSKATETLDMLQRGQVKIGTHMDVNEGFSRDLRQTINNFSLAIMAAGLFLGSCVLCLTDLQPRLLSVPVLGLVCFAFGFALAIVAFLRIYRDGKKK